MTMDDPSMLRRKAVRLHERASSASAEEATKLHEAANQLELWADDLEQSGDARQNSSNRSDNAERD